MLMFQTTPDTTSRKKKRSRPSSSGMLVFIAAFFACLLIFAGIGVIWWHVADPQFPFLSSGDDGSTTPVGSSSENTPRFDKNDRFATAVYITDDNGNLQTVSLAMMQPDSGSVTAIGLPSELALFDTDYDTLERRFQMDGVEAAQMALGAYFHQPIDYYIVLSYSQVETYFDQLGQNLIVKLDKNVDQQPSDGSFSIHLTAGEQALSSKQTANLLRCDNWQGGKKERADMHASLVDAYIDQFLSTSRDMQTDVSKLQTVGETNLSGERYNTVDATLTYLAKCNKGSLCTTVSLDGTFDGAGEFLRFTPSQKIVETITSALKSVS